MGSRGAGMSHRCSGAGASALKPGKNPPRRSRAISGTEWHCAAALRRGKHTAPRRNSSLQVRSANDANPASPWKRWKTRRRSFPPRGLDAAEFRQYLPGHQSRGSRFYAGKTQRSPFRPRGRRCCGILLRVSGCQNRGSQFGRTRNDTPIHARPLRPKSSLCRIRKVSLL
jgi:hypothetical protein